MNEVTKQEIGGTEPTAASNQELKAASHPNDAKVLDELYIEVKKLKESAESTIKEVREQRGILFLGYIICILMVATIFITFLIFLFDKFSSPVDRRGSAQSEYLQ